MAAIVMAVVFGLIVGVLARPVIDAWVAFRLTAMEHLDEELRV